MTRIIALVILIGITSGCMKFEQVDTSIEATDGNKISNNSTLNISDTDVKQVICNLGWKIETEYIDDILTSYLYLYSKDNVQVKCEVGDITGHVESIEEYKDRYPEDGILPIVSWFGGGGAELVGRYIDKNTIVIMIKTIGDAVGYGVDWDEYEEWCTISIEYNEQGQVESLLKLDDSQSEKNDDTSNTVPNEDITNNVSINNFIGKWKIASVAWETKQHNYIGIMDEIIGTTVILKEDYYELGEDIISNPIISLEKIDDIHFLTMYAAGSEKKAREYSEMYGLCIQDTTGTIGYMYYMDGEIWCEYEECILFRLEKIE